MLAAATEFPQVGSHCFFDDVDQQNRPVVEPARILRNNGDGTVLVSLTDRRYPSEVASGNRTVELARLRATEKPEFPPAASSGRKPKAKKAVRR